MNDDYYNNPNQPQSPYSPQADVGNPFAAAPEESPFTAEQLRQHLNSGLAEEGGKKKSKLKLVVVAIAVLAVMAVLMMVLGVFSSSEDEFNAAPASDGLSISGSEPIPAAPVSGDVAAPVAEEVTPGAGMTAPVDAAPMDMNSAAPADAASAAPADPFAPVTPDAASSPSPAAAESSSPAAMATPAADDFTTKCTTKFNDDIKARGQNPDQYPTARDDYVKNCVEYLSKQVKPQ